ncbi:MAG: acyl-homoserine-lactone acylase, partial [Solirubrobacteraceae bacterium]|nr:acyl-homoserine-lactone acylase [Solirubrobacteraceae bacterium]
YGYGYAFAQYNLCTIAEQYVTVRAERSRYFGPDKEYTQRGNGFTVNNLNSDIFWKQVSDSRVVDHLLARRPPFGPKSEIKELVRGYVAGYNRYLRAAGGFRHLPDRICRGKPWVRPISIRDAYLRFYQLVLLASGDVAIDGIASATPPTGIGMAPPRLSAAQTARALARRLPDKDLGSNAVAIGRAGSRDHRHGVLLGNPHFPWLGTERFYQAQLRIPGKIDVSGASLYGVPLVLIGHTKSMAWSHTVSTAYRFTPYQLSLIPGSPTSYLYDGNVLHMTSRRVTVQVRQPSGRLAPVSRRLYSSRFGAIFTSLAGVPLPWLPSTAFAFADANADNFRIFNHFIDTDRAQSAPQELRILKRYEGIPWVNTIVADRGGRALYADIGTVPNVSDAKAQQCNTGIGFGTTKLLGLPVLDGSKSACNWGNDADAVQHGLFGPGHMPQLFRSDFVTNSNDSYWLSNPHHPLTGFARIIGDEKTERSLRTRIGLIMTQARVDGSDHRGPAGFTRQDMQNMVWSDRQYAGELTRNDLVAMCRSFGGNAPTSSGPPVAVGTACNVLARWDLHENVGSRGAILFRRFWTHASGGNTSPFAHPFSEADPVHTPNTLDTTNPTVRTALGDAINDLRGAHIPLDATVGSVQFVRRGRRHIPIHGGPGDPNGQFNAIHAPFHSGSGFAPIDHGSSFIQVVTWHAGHCPDARTIITYSQSSNPRSRYAADQTALFSRKRWVVDRYCRADVLRATLSTTTLRQGRRVRVTHPRRRH